jgi:hypothetical protein
MPRAAGTLRDDVQRGSLYARGVASVEKIIELRHLDGAGTRMQVVETEEACMWVLSSKHGLCSSECMGKCTMSPTGKHRWIGVPTSEARASLQWPPEP